MEYRFSIDGNTSVVIRYYFFTGRTRVLVNGTKVKKARWPNKGYAVTDQAGLRRIIVPKNLSGITRPHLLIDGLRVNLSDKAPWYNPILILVPAAATIAVIFVQNNCLLPTTERILWSTLQGALVGLGGGIAAVFMAWVFARKIPLWARLSIAAAATGLGMAWGFGIKALVSLGIVC